MKRVIVVAIFAALVTSLYGQSVADLAKREKARRESLGAKRAKVVTNADLAAVRKTPALVVRNPDSAEEANPSGVVGADASGVVPAGSTDNSGAVVMTPRVVRDGPGLFADSASPGGPSSGADAAARLKAAEDLIDLLTTKINALMQQANNLDSMTPKDAIQKQLDETNQKLLRVQDEAAKLRSQIEAGKQNPPDKR
jgi:hypothetical protein